MQNKQELNAIHSKMRLQKRKRKHQVLKTSISFAYQLRLGLKIGSKLPISYKSYIIRYNDIGIK